MSVPRPSRIASVRAAASARIALRLAEQATSGGSPPSTPPCPRHGRCEIAMGAVACVDHDAGLGPQRLRTGGNGRDVVVRIAPGPRRAALAETELGRAEPTADKARNGSFRRLDRRLVDMQAGASG